jgi:hypothetical protein
MALRRKWNSKGLWPPELHLCGLTGHYARMIDLGALHSTSRGYLAPQRNFAFPLRRTSDSDLVPLCPAYLIQLLFLFCGLSSVDLLDTYCVNAHHLPSSRF